MKTLVKIALVTGGLWGALMLLDPRAFMLPFWLLSQPWKDECSRSPVSSYIGGTYSPCTGSPLTASNANPSKRSKDYCPLMGAVLSANVAVFDELLGLGADPKLCAGYPETYYQNLVDVTCRNSDVVVESFLNRFMLIGIPPPDAQELLFLSAKGSCEPGIRLASALGANVNAEDRQGKTAMHYVIGGSERGLRLTKVLTSLGANARLPVSSGETALEQAKRLNGLGAWAGIERAAAVEEVD